MAGLHVLLVWGLTLPGLLSGVGSPLTRHSPEIRSGSAPNSTNPSPQIAGDSQTSKTEPKHTVLQGRVVCLDSHGQPLPADKECPEPFKLVLNSNDGRTHSFVSNDALAPMLADTRVRPRTLRITALVHSDDKLEALSVQSIKGGKVYDIYYFCQLCNITTYTPGPCPCCRQELEFKEAPAAEP